MTRLLPFIYLENNTQVVMSLLKADPTLLVSVNIVGGLHLTPFHNVEIVDTNECDLELNVNSPMLAMTKVSELYFNN